MTGSPRHKKIDELSARAGEALARGAVFEAERMAEKALLMARQDNEFERMIHILTPLREARRQRVRLAMESGKVAIVDVPVTEDMKIQRGCHLVQPPQVGSDARRLRLAALINDIPVIVLCREPLTQTRLVPVVAISPGSTIRVKVPPPHNDRKPDLGWFTDALVQLGDGALEGIDYTQPLCRRIDMLVEYLDALPEHEKLHDALAETCREACKLEFGSRTGPKTLVKTKIKST